MPLGTEGGLQGDGGIGRPLTTVTYNEPAGWDTQWQIAKAAAIGGTGVARVAWPVGNSIAAGQYGNAPASADALRYGVAGRLKTLLLQSMPLCADGFTVASCAPGTLTSPSSPYAGGATTGGGNAAFTSFTQPDGGCGQVFLPSTTGGTFGTIYMPRDLDTNAWPAAGPGGNFIDLLTVDFNTNQWSYNADSGAATGTITGAGSGTIGAGIMRRTGISSLTGGQVHNVALTNVSANGLLLSGHVTYYGTTGLQYFRNGIPGAKMVDFATGGGATAGRTGSSGMSADQFQAWTGQSNAGVGAGVVSAFPFNGLDLAIILPFGNDVTYGSPPKRVGRALSRLIDAIRRGNPATGSNGPGCSILIVDDTFIPEYSDNNTGLAQQIGGNSFLVKETIRSVASYFQCAYVDMRGLFGSTGVNRGLEVSGQPHPTQQPALAATASPVNDGHLLLAQTIYGLL